MSEQPIPFGTHGSWWWPHRLNISTRDIKTHIHTIGVSGSGKSRSLAAMFLMLTMRGLSATLIDPHGDLAKLVLGYLVKLGKLSEQTQDSFIYLDLPESERRQRYLPFNVLNQSYDPHTTARNVLEAMRRSWPSLDQGNAPNFENIVLAGTYVLIKHDLPLALLHDLLIEREWRDSLLTSIDDEQVVRFFKDRYDRWNRDQPMLIESTLRRIFLLAFSPVLRYSLSQRENVLNFRRILDSNQSLIINLALGDSDARRLLGCLLTVNAEQAALSRSDLPPQTRLGSHHLILDEFSEFSAQSEESLSRILSLCRKYGLYLVMAHQTFSQASSRLRGALQNCGIEQVFRLGRDDSEYAATILGRVNPMAVKHEAGGTGSAHPLFYTLGDQWEEWVQKIQDLRPRECFVKTPDGKVTKVKTLSVPDPRVDAARVGHFEEYYLEKYFRPRDAIEVELASYRPTRPPTTRMRPLGRKA